MTDVKEIKTIFIRSLAVKEKGKYFKGGTSLRKKLFCFLFKARPHWWVEEKEPMEEKG